MLGLNIYDTFVRNWDSSPYLAVSARRLLSIHLLDQLGNADSQTRYAH